MRHIRAKPRPIWQRPGTLRSILLLQTAVIFFLLPHRLFNLYPLGESQNCGQLTPNGQGNQQGSHELSDGELDIIRKSLISGANSGKIRNLDPDPLDDFLFLEGFPKEAATPESAKLCDHNWNIVFKDSWKCPEDPTCLQCTVQAQKRFDEVFKAFKQPDLLSRRRQYISSNFKDKTPTNTIAIFGVNYGQLYLFLNWACGVQRLGIDPTSISIIVPTDEQSYNILKRLGFHVIDIAWIQNLDKKISSSYRGNAMSGDHSRINNVILLLANEIIQMDFSIILHDVDISWNQNILPFLQAAGERRDVLGMYAPYYVAKGGINSGFVFVNPTRKGKILMQSLENLAPLKVTSDQELWNTVLRHIFFQQLSMRILPQQIFYKYSGHHAAWPDKDLTLLFHSVGNGKRTHLEFFGQWHLDASCKFYDRQVDEESQKRVQEGASKFYQENMKKP